MNDQAMLDFLTQEGYIHLRLHPRGAVGIHRLAFTCAVLLFDRDTVYSWYSDRWCYHNEKAAVDALNRWDGTGEPDGWHRHPSTGRRRPDGDASKEYISP